MKIQQRAYTEQYILALFLYKNPEWQIIFSTHKLDKDHKLPFGGSGSFWIRKIK